jgi:lipopolysaccharide biosynthesis glycosyltransferase
MSGKLYTYSLQCEPFVHLDYDLYLLKPLPYSFQNMPVVVQCEELFIHTDIYSWGINFINSNNNNVPPAFSYSKNIPYQEQKAYNMGLIGGQNHKDIARFGTEALQLIRDNLAEIKALPTDKQNILNIVYEQYFFTQFMLYNHIPVTIYMPDALKRYKFDNDIFVHLLSKVKAYHAPCVEMEEVYLSKYSLNISTVIISCKICRLAKCNLGVSHFFPKMN